MKTQFAVNYSVDALALLREGRVDFDLFKCPPWPELLPGVTARPPYVHFSLRAGPGKGDGVSGESARTPDWDEIERFLEQTESRWVNLHLAPSVDDYPEIPRASVEPAHVERVAEGLVRDVAGVVARFGAENVVVENVFSYGGHHLTAGFLPETVTRVVEETGCGLILDIAHALIASEELQIETHAYLEALPTHRLKELHVSGVRRFEGPVLERAREIAEATTEVERLAGKRMDHLPMTGEDWALTAWVLERVRAGAWANPGLVTLEMGGIGPFFSILDTKASLAEEITRLGALLGKDREK